VVIGAGQAGGPLAGALAKSGLHTALVERKHVGGTCINEGCTPTKTMVASARVAYLARRGADYGVQGCAPVMDMNRVRQRKRDIVSSFRNGSQKRIEEVGKLDLIFGDASFTGSKSLQIRLKDGGQQSITADRIFLNTGTRASRPSIPGIDAVHYLDNASIMELAVLPEHLIILGGGYIGVEFGQMFRRFGSCVTIIQSGSQLLAHEDSDVADEIAKILREDGIELLLDTKAQQIRQSGNAIEIEFETGGRVRTLSSSHLLAATGRVPNTETLNLPAAGVATDDRGFIKVTDRLETNVDGIFALGDVKGGPAFTHISYDDFRIVRANLLENKQRSTADRMVPYTVFVDPQLGRIGMTETEALSQGRKFRVAKLPMSSVARALEMDESRGFMKALVDNETGQILGAAVLGIEGGEIMSALQVAMMGKLPYTALKDGVFAHPTLAESLNNLFMTLN
jgi:pyruvate/2-oxoglutarate dehydrogenase complex dihydrolipoamide dehydrogenase (E3) component